LTAHSCISTWIFYSEPWPPIQPRGFMNFAALGEDCNSRNYVILFILGHSNFVKTSFICSWPWLPTQLHYVRHPQHTQTSSSSSTIAADSNNDVTNTICCRYSCLYSWRWVMVLPEPCRTVSRQNKPRKVASCWIYIRITSHSFSLCAENFLASTLNEPITAIIYILYNSLSINHRSGNFTYSAILIPLLNNTFFYLWRFDPTQGHGLPLWSSR
jgi:hypothetical protein